MSEDLKPYLIHYLKLPDALICLLISTGLLIALLYGIYAVVDKQAIELPEAKKKHYIKRHRRSAQERFFELIFSGTSMLFFISVYYLIERFVTEGAFREFWDARKDFLLLGLIIASMFLNRFLDRYLINLKHISNEEKAAARIISMVYLLLIFLYIKYVYENNNYDMFILYFLGLMIGRFVYFDASFGDFLHSMKNALKNAYLMLVLLGFTGIMSLYGFSTGYFVKHIGVITNVFYAHVCMCISIFVIIRLNLFDRIFGNVRQASHEAMLEDVIEIGDSSPDEYM